MPLTILCDGLVASYQIEISGSQKLLLSPDNDRLDQVEIEFPLLLDDANKEKPFDIYFLTNSQIKESDIFQIYDRGTGARIGWSIPLLSIESNLHDCAEDPHFLRYAYIIVRDALEAFFQAGFGKQFELTSGATLKFSDFFDESTVFLVISRETLVNGCTFNFESTVPSLVRYGYLPFNSKNPERFLLDMSLPRGPRLYLEQSTLDEGECLVVSSLLRSVASSEGNEILRFFYFYQIIELLLEKIFLFEHKLVVDEISNADMGSSKVKDALQRLNEVASEKKRLKLLINEYCASASHLGDLRSACNKLLVELGDTEATGGFEDFFYPIRNFIFHRYRSFPNERLPDLNNIVNEAIILLPLILNKFKLRAI